MERRKQMETNLIWKMAIASALSWEIAKMAGSAHPYLAPVSVIFCLQSTVHRSIQFSIHRMTGTVIGITLTVFALPYVPVNGLTVGLLILLGCFISVLLKQGETVIHQSALTSFLVFVIGHHSGDYYIDRFRDTLIGALTAVILHMLFYPPNFTKKFSKSLNEFSDHLMQTYQKVSTWIETGLTKEVGNELQLDVKNLLTELHQRKEEIKYASDSLKFNPFGKKSEKILRSYQDKLTNLNQGYNYISSVVATLITWSETEKISPLQQNLWAKQIKDLSTIFSAKEQHIDPTAVLIVKIPNEIEKQLNHFSLYHETIKLLKTLKF